MTRIVHGATPSPFVRKVLIALSEKGLDCELQALMPIPKTPELLALNPVGKIPIFQDGDLILPDSSVICAYLERTHPEPSLYPSDPALYGRARGLARSKFARSTTDRALRAFPRRRARSSVGAPRWARPGTRGPAAPPSAKACRARGSPDPSGATRCRRRSAHAGHRLRARQTRAALPRTTARGPHARDAVTRSPLPSLWGFRFGQSRSGQRSGIVLVPSTMSWPQRLPSRM